MSVPTTSSTHESATTAQGPNGANHAPNGAGHAPASGTPDATSSVPAPRGASLDPEDALVQLLTPAGERIDHPVYGPLVDELDEDTLRAMYRDMVLTRAFDTEATRLQRQGELGLWAPSLGQEGVQIGSAHAQRPADMIFPSYREHGVALVRGLPLTDLLPVMRSTRHGGWDPRAHNFQVQTFVLAAQTLHAVGYAMGIQRDGHVGTGTDADRAVVVYHGDGAASEGDFNESLVFAASAQAPVVLLCQNNSWAISVPTRVQSRVPIARRGPGVGIPAVRVDGNDVLASYAVTAEALRRARSGGGPTLIEAVTYRMGAHTTSDDPTRYRPRSEEEAWRAKDPIDRMRAHLLAAGHADDAFLAAVESEAEALARDARTACLAERADAPGSMFDHVHSLPHAQVEADREAMLAFEAGFADTETGTSTDTDNATGTDTGTTAEEAR
ncbi:pyruvate dehydrogenase (acetyl-transferring) E1 component subunit alpha [Georgenia sp. Z1344]|uniref:pyruvate dehydrogenase (acetyl-transferring) E1 component subunit alpha n=1 Tax=Georgenia sp. Z1344 TaxID=3416706 RepID=UPI003CEB086D